MWDTDNGPDFGDEINLVYPGFVSGWAQVQGIWTAIGNSIGPVTPQQPSSLVNFGGKGVYHVPQFTWNKTIGPTAIKFFDSDKLGIDNGNIYHFKLNKERNGLLLGGSLAGNVAYTPKDSQQAVFATGFDEITDLQVGSEDGYLYVLSYTGGAIYRIVRATSEDSDSK